MYKFILGLVLGVALALGVALYLNKNAVPFITKVANKSTDDFTVSTPVDMQPGQLNDDNTTNNSKNQLSSFDFYTVLKDSKGAKLAKGSNQDNIQEVYFVQAGVFTKEDLADQMKASLALNGYNVRITVEQNVTTTKYHVIVGPLTTKQDMQKTVDALSTQGYKTVELKSVN